MDIRGLNKFSLIDYPGKMACVVFAAGCNFRCPYCHNPHLVLDPESQPPVTHAEFIAFLDRRRGKLDAVVISGGEPTLQPDLAEFAAACRARGFLVKLDTNGSRPETIRAMMQAGLIDALAIDYKAPAAKCLEVAGCPEPGLATAVAATVRLAVDSNRPLDVRTTVHRDILSPSDLHQMRQELDALGVTIWTLQQFHPVDTLDPDLPQQPSYHDRELAALALELGGNTRTRGLKFAGGG